MAVIILLKNTTAREGNKIRQKGRIWEIRKKLEENEIFGRIGKNWENWRKSGKLTKFNRIDKIWNLDFVSLNHPDTC